jgi:hypothetical protein
MAARQLRSVSSWLVTGQESITASVGKSGPAKVSRMIPFSASHGRIYTSFLTLFERSKSSVAAHHASTEYGIDSTAILADSQRRL